jgi:hypothetical protein
MLDEIVTIPCFTSARRRKIMTGHMLPAILGLLMVFGCSGNDDPVDTTDYSAQLYGKWQATSGGGELKYMILEPERRMSLLGEDSHGLRGVVTGAFAADANYLSLGGTVFLYSRSTDLLGILNAADTINFILTTAAPAASQWVRPVDPTDSIPAPVNQRSDIGSDSTNLWMGSGLAGNPVLYRINLATRAVTTIIPPLLVTASEWDGGALWCSGAFTSTLSRIDTGTGGALSTSPTIGGNIFGLAWDGQYLWAGSQSAASLSVYNPQTNSVIQTVPGVYGDGMAFSQGFLYLCKDGAIHKCIPSPFRAVGSYSIPGARSYGIASDGTALWVTATRGNGPQYIYTIYRISL